jgi:hypothetical protein
VRVTAVVLVLVTERRTVVRELVIGAVVGVGVAAVAAAAGWSGAFDACRFSLAKIVIALKLLKVIAAASTRSAAVDAMSGLRRVRVVT